MDSLHLILADDAVPEGPSGLNQEHGVRVAALAVLAGAGAAVVPCPAAVVDLARLDGDG